MKNISVIEGVEPSRKASLNANFARAAFPGFDRAMGDFFQRQKVSIVFARRAAESAEATAHKTHIGKIDIAIDYVGYNVADPLMPHVIGSEHKRIELGALGSRQLETVIEIEFTAFNRAGKKAGDFRINSGKPVLQLFRLAFSVSVHQAPFLIVSATASSRRRS